MRFPKDLGRSGLSGAVAERFDRTAGPVDGRRFDPGDHLMSAFTMLPLKMLSLLQCDLRVSGGDDPVLARNLRTLFGLERVPSDIWMRQQLD